MSVPTKQPEHNVIESVIANNDLSKLTPAQRNDYYVQVCKSIGLNPLTQPFQYIMLNGKLTLYARRDAADQLRKINGISVTIVSQDMADGLLTVHVRAKDRDGREDEDLGVVAMPDGLKGEARANAILKAVTKAKRRVTLSISGLGFLDETEIDDIPVTEKRLVALNGNGNGRHSPVTIEQLGRIQQALVQGGVGIDWLLKFLQKRGLQIERLEDIPHVDYEKVMRSINSKAAARELEQQDDRPVATDPGK